MKVPEYIIVNDKNNYDHPTLLNKYTYKWNGNDFDTVENIVAVMNDCFYMNKLSNEYLYVISFSNALKLKGIMEISSGNHDETNYYNGKIATFLLLSGAEQFELIHNHPNGSTEISDGDIEIYNDAKELGNMLDIRFLDSIIIGEDSYELTSSAISKDTEIDNLSKIELLNIAAEKLNLKIKGE